LPNIACKRGTCLSKASDWVRQPKTSPTPPSSSVTIHGSCLLKAARTSLTQGTIIYPKIQKNPFHCLNPAIRIHVLLVLLSLCMFLFHPRLAFIKSRYRHIRNLFIIKLDNFFCHYTISCFYIGINVIYIIDEK